MSDQLYYTTILNYIQIANVIKSFDSLQHYQLIKYLENTYDDEADTLLGDFIDEMVQLYMYDLYNDDLYIEIQQIVDSSEINVDLAYTISESILQIIV